MELVIFLVKLFLNKEKKVTVPVKIKAIEIQRMIKQMHQGSVGKLVIFYYKSSENE